MTVYVDDMLRRARPTGYRGPGSPLWSHLMADTTDELLTFAALIGLRREWIQKPGTPHEHFDVTATTRAYAIQHGAVEISYPRGTALLIARRREATAQQLTDNRSYPTPTEEKP